MKCFKINRKFLLLMTLFIFTESLYAQRNDELKIDTLIGIKIVEGKWGNGPGEFGIVWEDGKDFPFGPYIKPAVDTNGNIYINDKQNVRIMLYSRSGEYIRSYVIYGNELQIDKEGYLYLHTREGIKVLDKSGEFENLVKLPDDEKSYLFWGIDEEGHLLVKDIDEHIQYVLGNDGGVLKKGEKYRTFTPIANCEYEITHDSKNRNMTITIHTDKTKTPKQEAKIRTGLMAKIEYYYTIPLKVSISGNLIVTARMTEKPYDYIIMYVDITTKKIKKIYVFRSEKSIKGITVTNNPPILGQDGNIYQSGYSAKKDNPSYGGFWVKKYTLPEEDRPR